MSLVNASVHPMRKLFIQHRYLGFAGRTFVLFAWAISDTQGRMDTHHRFVEITAEGQENDKCIDLFLDCWHALGAQAPVEVFCSLDIVRAALDSVPAERFPGLTVVGLAKRHHVVAEWFAAIDHLNTVTGYWCEHTCRIAGEVAKRRMEQARAEKVALRVERYIIATDASKGRRRQSGWGFATSRGEVCSGVVSCKSITDAEFYAVAEAIKHASCVGYKKHVARLDILVDSRPVVKALTAPTPVQYIGDQELYDRTRALLAGIEQSGITVTIHWVKAHAGHVLNEAADRLARNSRRFREWRIGEGTATMIVERIRTDLIDGIRGVAPEDLVPSSAVAAA